jgi:hypothetical protein
MTKQYVNFCLNSQVDESKMCSACTLSKKSRIERDERFLEVEKSEWNKRALMTHQSKLKGYMR